MTQRATRRDFLKHGSALGTGFFISHSAAPLHAWNSPNDRVNVACIGVGGRGYGDLQGVARENVVALCDCDENRAAKAFKEFPKAKKYQDYRQMLEEQKDLEAITVATPDHNHAPAAAMGLKLGKHVYCEKPLTHSVYEARVLTRMSGTGLSSTGSCWGCPTGGPGSPLSGGVSVMSSVGGASFGQVP